QDARTFRRQFFEMNARGFIGAVLAPHHLENAELGLCRLAFQDLSDFVEFERGKCTHAVTRERTMLSRMTLPSSDPISASAARSGCGIMPITLRRSLQIPAMSPSDPLGLSM